MTQGAEEGTLEPTPERLRRARREGDFGASGAPAGALAFLGFVVASPAAARALEARSGASLRSAIDRASGVEVSLEFSAKALALDVLSLAAPLLLLAAMIAMLATLLETRFGFAPARLLRGPGAGGGSASGAMRAALYAALALVLAGGALLHVGPAAARLAGRAPSMALRLSATLGLRTLELGAALSLVVAAVDLVAARLARRARLRMPPRAVEDERRASEGDPLIRAARRRAADLARLEAPLGSLADEHAVCVEGDAVALVLAWRPELDAAPRLAVVRRGDAALTLTRDAASHAIPVHRDPWLAAGLADGRDVGDAIAERDYEAVAAILEPPPRAE